MRQHGSAIQPFLEQDEHGEDAQVFKKYSQMKLQMKREALAKLNRKASEAPQTVVSGSDTENAA